MNALHSALQSLKDKHKAFIGNRKDQITSANAEGFKQGLAWAIETIETAIEQEQFEEQYNKEQEELISLQNRYKYDVMGSFKSTLETRLKTIKEEQTWDEWQDGVKFGREDMLEELIQIINRDYLNYR